MDPPRQNTVIPRDALTPPGHYSNPMDNLVAAAARLEAIPIEGDSPQAVETRQVKELLMTASPNRKHTRTAATGSTRPPVQAGAIADIWMNQQYQLMNDVEHPMVTTRRVEVMTLRKW